jgi:3,4-dihydroxybenzoyl-citryl-spermidine/N-citryl-spermidine--spermidine ligase
MPLPLDFAGQPADRVLRQLVAALLFEGLAFFTITRDDRVSFTLDDSDYRCRASFTAFGRIRIQPRSIEMKGGDGRWIAATLASVVRGLPGTGITRGKLLREMEQTIALCRWSEEHIPPRARRDMAFAELEAALDEGHPYHPCFKARYGFTLRDNQLYGPESMRPFQLVWALVERDDVRQELPRDEDSFWRHELSEDTLREIESRREAKQLSWNGYVLLPIHPWQWRHLKNGAAAKLVADGRLHALGELGDRYLASQSLRTLHNLDRPSAASIKLPLDVVNTSSRRILDPHSVCTAPVLSRWIADMVKGDPAFTDRYPLSILQEYAGVLAEHSGDLSGQIGAIWRESATAGLQPGETIIPFNALMMLEADGKPFVDPWIERFGVAPWLKRLLEIVVLPVWHLLVHHGLAMEAHGQNMMLVHRDGWPERLVLRDFHESVEFSPAFLREPDSVPDFLSLNPLYRDAKPDQYYWTDNVDSMRELVVDTLFIYNLSEVTHLFEQAYRLPEADVWKHVEQLLQGYGREHDAGRRMTAIGYDQPTILTESLLTRKLLTREPEYHHPVSNVLANVTSQRRIMP